MGMKLQSTWQCERCGHETCTDLDEVPAAWQAVTTMRLFVNIKTHTADTKMPSERNTYILCSECMRHYYRFMPHSKSVAPESEAQVNMSDDEQLRLQFVDDGDIDQEVLDQLVPVVGEDPTDGLTANE